MNDSVVSAAHRVSRPAVFLDRDGVLIEDSASYIRRVEDVRLVAGAAPAVRRLNDYGVPVIVVTNQSAVARGFISEADLEAINARMFAGLAEASGAHIDRLYYCPYHPDGVVPEYTCASSLRKPSPGMLLQAAGDFDVDLARSFMVGDQESDMIAARRAGCRAIAVLTGLGRTRWEDWTDGQPDSVAADLPAAVDQILDLLEKRRA
jgi:D-glycero-D-manno-heptose 1,7-bisphosphate phosphatase